MSVSDVARCDQGWSHPSLTVIHGPGIVIFAQLFTISVLFNKLKYQMWTPLRFLSQLNLALHSKLQFVIFKIQIEFIVDLINDNRIFQDYGWDHVSVARARVMTSDSCDTGLMIFTWCPLVPGATLCCNLVMFHWIFLPCLLSKLVYFRWISFNSEYKSRTLQNGL